MFKVRPTTPPPFWMPKVKTLGAMGLKVPQRVRTNSPRSSKIWTFSEAHCGVTEGVRVPVGVKVGVAVEVPVGVKVAEEVGVEVTV